MNECAETYFWTLLGIYALHACFLSHGSCVMSLQLLPTTFVFFFFNLAFGSALLNMAG